MQDWKLDIKEIKIQNNSSSKGSGQRLAFSDYSGKTYILNINKSQKEMLDARKKRFYYVPCHKGKILNEIQKANDYVTLENLAKEYYICDTCSFDDISLEGARCILNVAVQVLYKYPQLRTDMCFLGTYHGFKKKAERLANGDEEVLNEFNLGYLCTQENTQQLGGLMYSIIDDVMKRMDSDKNWACAMNVFGLFDAVLVDRNDYCDSAYQKFATSVRNSVSSGFHPQGCESPESVMYHELGHLMDDICGLSKDSAFIMYHKRFTKEKIKEGLSEYALENIKEFIAEAFSEYMCNPKPRPIANRVGKWIDIIFKSLFKS